MPGDDEKKPETLTVSVVRQQLTPDSEAHVFYVLSIRKGTVEWPEGFDSKIEALACLRGMAAMARMLGHQDIRIPGLLGLDEAKD